LNLLKKGDLMEQDFDKKEGGKEEIAEKEEELIWRKYEAGVYPPMIRFIMNGGKIT
jgi:hypothetical protein